MITKRAQGLAINQLILVALGVIVLIAMAFFLFGGIDTEEATPCIAKFGYCTQGDSCAVGESAIEGACSEGYVCCPNPPPSPSEQTNS